MGNKISNKTPGTRTKSNPAQTKTTSPSKPKSSPADQILHLQKTMGNQAVQRMIQNKTLQAKLKVGQPNDPYEREADRVADRVTAGLSAPPISRIPSGGLDSTPQKQENKEENLQTKLVQHQENEEEEAVQTQLIQRQETEEEEAVQTIQRQESEEEEAVQTLSIQRQETEEEEPVQAQFVQRQESEEEENLQTKLIQRQEAEEEEESVQTIQRQDAEEEEPVQTLAIQRQETEEEESVQTIQRQETGGGTGAASQAINHKSGGTPLNPSMQNTLESGMGADLSGVRVHNDSAAHDAADALNARAFTHGSDIWLSRNASPNDMGLMAHEATHVVQQGSSVQCIQRDANKATGKDVPVINVEDKINETTSGEYSGKEGTINKNAKKMTLSYLKVPNFKKTFGASSPLPKKTDEKRADDQRQIWEKEAKSGAGFEDKLNSKLKEERSPTKTKGGQPIYFLKIKKEDNYIIGNQTTIRNRSLRPFWNKKGKRVFYDVDHQRELQLGGPNDINNMWLLESTANRSSGRNIKNEKNERIKTLLDDAVGTLWDAPPSVEYVRRNYEINTQKVIGGLKVDGNPKETWSIEEIRDQATQLDALKALTKQEIEDAGLMGTAEELVIYTNEAGGGMRRIPWGDKKKNKPLNIPLGQNFYINKVDYVENKGGTVTGTAFPTKTMKSNLIKANELTLDVAEMDAVNYGGYITSTSIKRELKSSLEIEGMSPVEIEQAELSPAKGFVARGKILPTVPIFKDIDIDLMIDGTNIYISKIFNTGDFSLPGPIQVTDSSLELFAGTQGIGANGEVLFEVERVGKGKLWGTASTGTGQGGSFGLGGQFDFDSKLFDEAKIKLEYTNEQFKGSGTLKIKKGKVKGIKYASVDVNVNGESWDASGTVEPDIPGIKKGNITAKYDKEKGFEIGGSLEFSDEIPGIKSGSLEVQVTPAKEGEGYAVKAAGEAQADIPGVDAKIKAEYDDGLFSAVGTVGYEKGMLKGSLTLGVTNRKVNEKGELTGEPGEKLILYGGGSVSIQIAPWLQGTAELNLKPNGEIEVAGKIGIPDTIDVFPEKKLDKRLFGIDIKIPILGFTVAGKGVGIFAVIGGGLDLMAGFGPGQLRECEISVKYNPDKEEDTAVSGKALFVVPANAGLRLFVKAGVGASLLIVSAELGVEIGAFLGVEGEAKAGVQVDWSPKKGLSLEATGEIFAEPKFKFDITGYALIEADLWLTSIELYEKRWKFAEFEFGSGLRIGAKFPIKYQEGEPFDISLSDVEFEYPDIDAMELLEGLFDEIT